jgi:phage/plasmid-associated DNA primase
MKFIIVIPIEGFMSMVERFLLKKELAAMHAYIPTHQVSEIINTIKSKTYTDRKEFDSKIEWVACTDCMINLITGETRPHSPDFMVTMQIPVTYQKFLHSPNTQFLCPRIMKFLHEIVSDRREVDTILDFLAYALWREMKIHKLLILNGEGRNGKSTLCKLITCFFRNGKRIKRKARPVIKWALFSTTKWEIGKY